MGIPIDLFEDPNLNEGFLCTICQDVLQDATMLDPCEHAFCRACIELWQQQGGQGQGKSSKIVTCPIDRGVAQGFKKPPRIYMSVLNGLQLRCPFQDGDGGCNIRLLLGDFDRHTAQCSFNPEVQEKECEGGCGALLRRGQRQSEHNCVEYLRRALTSTEEELKRSEAELETVKYELVVTKHELELARAIGNGNELGKNPLPEVARQDRQDSSPQQAHLTSQSQSATTLSSLSPKSANLGPVSGRTTAATTAAKAQAPLTSLGAWVAVTDGVRCSYRAPHLSDRAYQELMGLVSSKLRACPAGPALSISTPTPEDRMRLQKLLQDAPTLPRNAQVAVVGKLSGQGLAEPDRRDLLILSVGNATKIRIWTP